MTQNEETAIQKEILCKLGMYEKQNGIKIFRMNNAGVYNEYAHAFQKTSPWHPAGLADIMIFCKPREKQTCGSVIFMEIKTIAGTQLPSQIEFQRVCETHGILYAVVRSPKEACDVLREAGIIGGELEGLITREI